MPAIEAISIPAKSVGRWHCSWLMTRPAPVARELGRMRTDTTSAASAIFAANRARGAVSFDVHQVDGVTRRRHLHESGSLRVRFPSPQAEGLSAVFVNTAAGVPGARGFAYVFGRG